MVNIVPAVRCHPASIGDGDVVTVVCLVMVAYVGYVAFIKVMPRRAGGRSCPVPTYSRSMTATRTRCPGWEVFRANHPSWTLGYDASRDLWRAHRVIGADGSEEHVRYLLRDLLDSLEGLPDV